jgi:hypothetical protein
MNESNEPKIEFLNSFQTFNLFGMTRTTCVEIRSVTESVWSVEMASTLEKKTTKRNTVDEEGDENGWGVKLQRETSLDTMTTNDWTTIRSNGLSLDEWFVWSMKQEMPEPDMVRIFKDLTGETNESRAKNTISYKRSNHKFYTRNLGRAVGVSTGHHLACVRYGIEVHPLTKQWLIENTAWGQRLLSDTPVPVEQRVRRQPFLYSRPDLTRNQRAAERAAVYRQRTRA